MTKIVLNGAGSVEFTKELLADILGFDELAGSTIALFDVDGGRLETAAAIARWTAGAITGRSGEAACGSCRPPALHRQSGERMAGPTATSRSW